MGYYSQFNYEIVEPCIVDKEKLEEFEKFFSNGKNGDLYGFYGVKLHIDENNASLLNIELEDYYNKFYDDKLFAVKLSLILKSGNIRLEFTGEDMDKWAYSVSPDKVEELFPLWITYDEFETIAKVFPFLKK